MPTFDSIDHLNFEAVAALIDDELTPTALHRAQQHLLQCPDCRREVAQQRAAAEAVREHNTDGCLRAPRSLVERLALLDEHPTPDSDASAASSSRSGLQWPMSWSRLRDGLR
ncbi:anti-sigma factor family protein [Corynebacterium appendicis]|uniref:anti-sigma factor family protein n=1 Tax=Corynebacterium appendicis TaxID=163202 RepID=UPI00254E00EF|nr:zf-HC2 domain-containing protein [Corynebacterium appendicis]MDK8626493.1 zf-HC2 domain-containing protein [Corynebacterium appendicis]